MIVNNIFFHYSLICALPSLLFTFASRSAAPPQYLESMRHRVTEQYFTCRNGLVSLSRGRRTSSGSTAAANFDSIRQQT